MLNPKITKVTAFAPASCANVAVGFDILAFPFADVGDYVTLVRRRDKKVVIDTIEGTESIPFEVEKNSASAVVQAIVNDLDLAYGFSIAIKKGIPLGSGMGGSAASTIAALIAVNAFLTSPLSPQQKIHYALLGEEVASGSRHLDNAVACLYGGLILIHTIEPLDIISLPLPEVHCVIVHPHFRLDTREARKAIGHTLPITAYIQQSAHLAAFIAALYLKDLDLLQRSLSDVLIEPRRAQLVPGFEQVKQAALTAGALGVSLSGAGPSLFALTRTHDQATVVEQAMRQAFFNHQLPTDSWITRMSMQPARVIEIITED